MHDVNANSTNPEVAAKLARARKLATDALELIENHAELEKARRELQIALDAMDALGTGK